ncbi:thioredoxin, partial [Zopfochytrium polystomum]
PPSSLVPDFTASWNPPCHAFSPYYAALAAKLHQPPHPTFFTLDVDALPDVAEDAGIAAMPTVVCYRAGEVVGTVVGADVEKLEEVVVACL